MVKLTNDDLDFIAGKRDELVAKIQERYGISKQEAQTQIDNWDPIPVKKPEMTREQERKAG